LYVPKQHKQALTNIITTKLPKLKIAQEKAKKGTKQYKQLNNIVYFLDTVDKLKDHPDQLNSYFNSLKGTDNEGLLKQLGL